MFLIHKFSSNFRLCLRKSFSLSIGYGFSLKNSRFWKSNESVCAPRVVKHLTGAKTAASPAAFVAAGTNDAHLQEDFRELTMKRLRGE